MPTKDDQKSQLALGSKKSFNMISTVVVLRLLGKADLSSSPRLEAIRDWVEQRQSKHISYFVIFSKLTGYIFKSIKAVEDERNESNFISSFFRNLIDESECKDEKSESQLTQINSIFCLEPVEEKHVEIIKNGILKIIKEKEIEKGKKEVYFLLGKIISIFLDYNVFDYLPRCGQIRYLKESRLEDIPNIAILSIKNFLQLRQSLTEKQLNILVTHKFKERFLSILIEAYNISVLDLCSFDMLSKFLSLSWVDNDMSEKIGLIFFKINKIFSKAILKYSFSEFINKIICRLRICDQSAKFNSIANAIHSILEVYERILHKDLSEYIVLGAIDFLEIFISRMETDDVALFIVDIEELYLIISQISKIKYELLSKDKFRHLVLFYGTNKYLYEAIINAINCFLSNDLFYEETFGWVLPASGLIKPNIEVFNIPDFDSDRFSDVLKVIIEHDFLSEDVFDKLLYSYQEGQCSPDDPQYVKNVGNYECTIDAIFAIENMGLLNKENLEKIVNTPESFFLLNKLKKSKILTQENFAALFISKNQWILTADAREIWEVIPSKLLTQKVFQRLLDYSLQEKPEIIIRFQVQVYINQLLRVLELQKIVREEANCYLSALASIQVEVIFLRFVLLMKQIESDNSVRCIFHYIECQVSDKVYAIYDRIYDNAGEDDLTQFIRSGKYVKLTTLKSFREKIEHSMGYKQYCSRVLARNYGLYYGFCGIFKRGKTKPDEQLKYCSEPPTKRSKP